MSIVLGYGTYGIKRVCLGSEDESSAASFVVWGEWWILTAEKSRAIGGPSVPKECGESGGSPLISKTASTLGMTSLPKLNTSHGQRSSKCTPNSGSHTHLQSCKGSCSGLRVESMECRISSESSKNSASRVSSVVRVRQCLCAF